MIKIIINNPLFPAVCRKRRALRFPALTRSLILADGFSCFTVMDAAPVLPGAGSLGNQLRQSQQVLPPALSAPDNLLLPQDKHGEIKTSDNSQSRMTLRKVIFSGEPLITGSNGITQDDLGTPHRSCRSECGAPRP